MNTRIIIHVKQQFCRRQQQHLHEQQQSDFAGDVLFCLRNLIWIPQLCSQFSLRFKLKMKSLLKEMVLNDGNIGYMYREMCFPLKRFDREGLRYLKANQT